MDRNNDARCEAQAAPADLGMCYYYYYYDPDTQFPGNEKNYAVIITGLIIIIIKKH